MKAKTYGIFQMATLARIERGIKKAERCESDECALCHNETRDNLAVCDRCYGVLLCDALSDPGFIELFPPSVIQLMKLEMFEAGIRCGAITQIGDSNN